MNQALLLFEVLWKSHRRDETGRMMVEVKKFISLSHDH